MTRHLKTLAPMAALLAGLTLAAQAPAEGRADVDAVYKLLPADTAFYGSMLRNREQVEIIGKSKAWARLMDLPAVKFARQEIAKKLADTDDPQTGQLAEFLKQPENKERLLLGRLLVPLPADQPGEPDRQHRPRRRANKRRKPGHPAGGASPGAP